MMTAGALRNMVLIRLGKADIPDFVDSVSVTATTTLDGVTLRLYADKYAITVLLGLREASEIICIDEFIDHAIGHCVDCIKRSVDYCEHSPL